MIRLCSEKPSRIHRIITSIEEGFMDGPKVDITVEKVETFPKSCIRYDDLSRRFMLDLLEKVEPESMSKALVIPSLESDSELWKNFMSLDSQFRGATSCVPRACLSLQRRRFIDTSQRDRGQTA